MYTSKSTFLSTFIQTARGLLTVALRSLSRTVRGWGHCIEHLLPPLHSARPPLYGDSLNENNPPPPHSPVEKLTNRFKNITFRMLRNAVSNKTVHLHDHTRRTTSSDSDTEPIRWFEGRRCARKGLYRATL